MIQTETMLEIADNSGAVGCNASRCLVAVTAVTQVLATLLR